MLGFSIDLLLVIALVITLFLSEVHRKQRLRPASSYRPVIISWWLPWLGNALQYKANPHMFVKRCRRIAGPAFTTLLAGRKITFLAEPSLISSMFRHSKDLAFTPIRADVHESAFGISREGAGHIAIEDEVYPGAFRHFSNSGLSVTTSRYSGRLLKTFRSIGSSISNQPISLWNLVFPISYTSSSKAIFGDSFPESTFSNFVTFDEGFTLLASHLPAIFTRTYEVARTRLITELVQWTNAARPNDMPTGVSPLVMEAVQSMQQANFQASDIGGHLLSLLWGTQANATWATFWFLAYLLQDEDRARRIREEIEDRLSSRFGGSVEAFIEAGPTALSSDNLVLLESGFRETMRLSAATLIARQIANDVTIRTAEGDPTHLVQGDVVFVSPRVVQMDATIFEDPSTFRLDRFVANNGTSLRQFTVNGRLLPYNLMTWGGGAHMCKGRAIAEYQSKMFVVLVLLFFDIHGSHVVNRTTGKPVDGGTLPRRDESWLAGVMHTNEDLICRLVSR